MEINKRKISFSFLILFIFVIYVALAILVFINKLQWIDTPLITLIRSFESDFLTETMKFFSVIGSLEIVILISIISLVTLYFSFGFKKELFFFISVSLGSVIINNLLKNIFQRERPDFNQLVDVAGYSFPSGHSMAAFTLYVSLTYVIWSHLESRLGRALIIIAVSIIVLSIGISRIYLGVHYPSDVLGGYMISGLWVYFSMNLWYVEIGET